MSTTQNLSPEDRIEEIANRLIAAWGYDGITLGLIEHRAEMEGVDPLDLADAVEVVAADRRRRGRRVEEVER